MGFITKLIASFFIVFVVILITALTVLQTHYGLTMVQKTLEIMTPFKLQASQLEYHLLKPFRLSLKMPELIISDNKTSAKRYRAQYFSASFPPFSLMQENITFKKVLIKGLHLNEFSTDILPENLRIEDLLLQDVSYSSEAFSFDKARVQFSKWENKKAQSHRPSLLEEGMLGRWILNSLAQQKPRQESEFQFSSQQVKIKQHLFRDVLINSTFKDNKWDIWEFSFKSAFGNVAGSVTLQDQNQWIFHHITISEARIENADLLNGLKKEWDTFNKKNNIEIKQLDLLDISASLKDVSIDHLNLLAHSLKFKQGKWVQDDAKNASISFSSNLLRIHRWVLTDVLGQFSIASKKINLDAMSAKIDDKGFLSLSGTLSPSSLTLNKLTLVGLDVTLTPREAEQFSEKLAFLKSIEIKELSVKHANYFLEDPLFPVQIAGLNLKGKQLTLRQGAKNGIYKGEITLSAIIANINHIPLLSSFAKISVTDGLWKLDPLNLSFIDGQIDASAEINLNKKSHPWSFKAQGSNVPIEIYAQWLKSNFPLKGEHDFEVDVFGISGNIDSFNYSLTGQFDAKLHQILLKTRLKGSLEQNLISIFSPLSKGQKTKMRPLKAEKITLRADRGKITLIPVKVQNLNEVIQLSGTWDLVTKEGGFLTDNAQMQK